MQIKDKFIDKKYNNIDQLSPKQLYERACNFFSQFPNINLENPKIRCPNCNILHKTYCLKCCELLVSKDQIPQINLPIDLIILHHEKEKHQKSSAIPAKFLCKNSEIISYPTNIIFEQNTYILYPHKDAKFLKELQVQEIKSIKKIVAIDCTWLQTSGIIENLQKTNNYQLKFIKLEDYETHFWRYQHHGLKCLATIEAIYYFYQEYAKLMNIDQEFKELLFFYKYTFQQINQANIEENVYEKISDKKKRIIEQKQNVKQLKFIKQ